MKGKILTGIIILGLVWVIGIIIDFDELSNKKINPEYQEYINKYKEETQKKYEELISELQNDYKIELDQEKATKLNSCRLSNFEGAEVTLAGIQMYNKIYKQKDEKPYYSYFCNGAKLDPDHPMYGLPDIEINIGPVKYFEPEKSSWESLIKLGVNNKPKPYKTYKKRIIVDSLGLQNKFVEMQLWLTTFDVVISVFSDRDKTQTNIDEASLDEKIYPGYWYKDTRSKISMNDLKHKEEWKNHLYSDINFVLKVSPNASPWYIKTEHTENTQPNIAVGAVLCNGLIKKPEDENNIHLQTFKGLAAPLYNKPFDEESPITSDLEESVQTLLEDLENVENENIWDKDYYVKLYSSNIGARQKGFFGTKKFDEQVEYSFLMPLLVVGSWDVMLPSEIIPELETPQTYYRSLSLKNLLPKWGLGFGSWISSILILVLVCLAFLYFSPSLLGKIFKKV